MGLEGKVEEELEINSPADKFFKRLSPELHHLPDASPDKVQGAEIHEGDQVTTGSVKLWNYTIAVDMFILSSIYAQYHKKLLDEENKTITLVGLSGHVLVKYKAYIIVYQVFPKGESGTVKLSLIYEKFKETDGEPHNYLKFGINVVKDLDKHLTPKKDEVDKRAERRVLNPVCCTEWRNKEKLLLLTSEMS
ncbi:hypothetical protein NL676_031974 [Syzygium grande]|nr:hypothetical protein NL676_031974 [Syzygium grande]